MKTTTWMEWLYYQSPPLLQTALLNAHAWRIDRHRYGPAYRQKLAWLNSRERATPDEVQAYQDERIREMVAWASTQSPYYRRLFRQLQVDPRLIQGVKDLGLIPVTTKAQVRAHWAEFLTSSPRRSWLKGVTSGTTGTPLQLWYDREMCLLNNAVDRRNKIWAGAGADDWFGILLGRIVVDSRRHRPPYWHVNFVQRQVWFSSFHLHDEYIGAMIAEMRKRKLRFLEGYPSTLHAIARFMLARGIEFPLTAAVSSSETLHDVQREEIERAFQCPLFDFYASAERVIFAAECDHHEGKHLIEEYGYVEVVDPEGRPLPPGTDGFLVGTSLHNTAMPLLRYQMSDVTHLRAAPCGCGRAGRMMANVSTKAEDLIITPRGRVVSPASLTHPFKTVRGVDRSQLVQERPDYLSVRIVANDAFTPAEQELLIGRLQDRLGDDMRIAIVRTSAIPREPSGKFRWIVSHVPAQQWLGVKEGRP